MHTYTLPRVAAPATAALVTAAGTWSVVVLAAPSWVGIAAASTCAVAAVAALIDLRMRRLPDHLIVLAVLPSLIAAVTVGSIGAATLGALAFAGPVALVHVAAPAAMGFGDVKLAVVLGIGVGLFDPAWSLVALCIASGLTAAVGLARRVASLPFGPGLVTGAVVAIVSSSTFPNGFTDGRLPWR